VNDANGLGMEADTVVCVWIMLNLYGVLIQTTPSILMKSFVHVTFVPIPLHTTTLPWQGQALSWKITVQL
jgi:hypothetical protein